MKALFAFILGVLTKAVQFLSMLICFPFVIAFIVIKVAEALLAVPMIYAYNRLTKDDPYIDPLP